MNYRRNAALLLIAIILGVALYPGAWHGEDDRRQIPLQSPSAFESIPTHYSIDYAVGPIEAQVQTDTLNPSDDEIPAAEGEKQQEIILPERSGIHQEEIAMTI